MTKAEWFGDSSIRDMLGVIRWRVNERKERLCSIAFCSRFVLVPRWRLPDLLSALEIAERWTDGLATEGEIEQACRRPDFLRVHPLFTVLNDYRHGGNIHDAAGCAWNGVEDVEVETGLQRQYLRDIFGNPFRPVAFDPAWRTEVAVGLAAKMYDKRDFAAMPILADALQEAGCEHPDILSHCREPGVHVRGCWVVDLVLEKE